MYATRSGTIEYLKLIKPYTGRSEHRYSRYGGGEEEVWTAEW